MLLVKSVMRSTALAAALIVAPALNGQQSTHASPGPVPLEIFASHKVFISNGGTDLDAQAAFNRAGEPEQAYDRFYSAMQSWGRYELVSSPGEADMVFEISFSAPKYMNDKLVTFEPQFHLRIFDAKTHFLLWSMTAPVEGAFRKATWLKNVDRGLDALMSDLKKLSTPAVVADSSKK